MSLIDKKKFVKKFTTRKDAIAAIDLFTEMINTGLYDPLLLDGLRKEIEADAVGDIPAQVLAYLNKVTNSSFRNTSHIEKICRAIPNATIDQFESIILFKWEKWGNDPMMSQYMTTATLFGSPNKFRTYLDEATNYWIKKAKDQALKFASDEKNNLK